MKTLIGKVNVMGMRITIMLVKIYMIGGLTLLILNASVIEISESIKHLFILISFYMALIGFTSIFLSIFVSCPHCGKSLTNPGFKKQTDKLLSDTNNVLKKWFTGSINCIHCGKEINTNDL